MTKMPSTRARLHDDLTKLGLLKGDGVFVHASLGAMGPVIGGARTVIDALFDAVGSEGLIGMPAFSEDARWPTTIERAGLSDAEIAEIEREVQGHDEVLSDCRGMGAIAETFRQWPGTQRSDHPNISVCLNGARAGEFIAPHSLAWGSGGMTPLGHLAKRPAMKVLLIGVGWNRCSALHTAEFWAKPRRTKVRRSKTGSGDAPWLETPDVADDLGRLFPETGALFEQSGNVTLGRVGRAECKLCDYVALLDFATEFIGAKNQQSGDLH